MSRDKASFFSKIQLLKDRKLQRPSALSYDGCHMGKTPPEWLWRRPFAEHVHVVIALPIREPDVTDAT
jgi:hypothetical protein